MARFPFLKSARELAESKTLSIFNVLSPLGYSLKELLSNASNHVLHDSLAMRYGQR
jgi:hypothetical protein